MAYRLWALIAESNTFRSLPDICVTAEIISLEHGYALMPITNALAAHLGDNGHLVFDDHFKHLTSGLRVLAKTLSMHGPVAYIEAEFWGPFTKQAANVWWKGHNNFGPVTEEIMKDIRSKFIPHLPLNRVLKELDVPTEDGRDCTDTLRLREHLSTEDWNVER